jgi:hypothetical protein
VLLFPFACPCCLQALKAPFLRLCPGLLLLCWQTDLCWPLLQPLLLLLLLQSLRAVAGPCHVWQAPLLLALLLLLLCRGYPRRQHSS